MDFHEARNRLRRMGKEDLSELASKQEISRCLIGGGACELYFRYKGFGFCVSEILGQGCQMERAKTPENDHKDLQKIDYPSLTEKSNRNGNGFKSTLPDLQRTQQFTLNPFRYRDRKVFL